MKADEIGQFLHKLCDLADGETLPRFRALTGVENKETAGFDPVTIADREAERVIREAIGAAYPTHSIFGEEFGASEGSSHYSWIIDPVDGTRSFISGIPLWGTLIGLYEDGRPLAGIMDQPFTGERYWSDGTTSSYQRNGSPQPITTSKVSNLAGATLLTTSPAIFSDEDRLIYDRLEAECELARYGTDCYAYCLLAAGQVDLVVESGLHRYDIAALIPIIENAGGVVTNWQGGSCAEGGRVLAAANIELHRAAMECLNQPV